MPTKTTTKQKKCLSPGCDRTELKSRGLCGSCYETLRRSVIAKGTTWKKLERAGLALGCNSPRGPAAKALQKLGK